MYKQLKSYTAFVASFCVILDQGLKNSTIFGPGTKNINFESFNINSSAGTISNIDCHAKN